MPRKTAEITLPTYAKYRPTGFDAAGLSLPDRQDWHVCPVIITRDTPEGSISESNWIAFNKALKAIDPQGEAHEIHRFGHWGPGWYEIVLVAPDSAALTCAQEMADALESYPILDDHDHSDREYAAALDSWDQFSAKELAATLGKVFALQPSTVERIKEIEPSALLAFMKEQCESWELHYEGEAPYFRFSEFEIEHSESLTRDTLARFLKGNKS